MDRLTDTLTAFALLALAWWIMSRVARAYSAEWQRVRDAHATIESAHDATTHTHDDDARTVLVIGDYDDTDALPYADDYHDATPRRRADATPHTTHDDAHDDYDDAHDDLDALPWYMT